MLLNKQLEYDAIKTFIFNQDIEYVVDLVEDAPSLINVAKKEGTVNWKNNEFTIADIEKLKIEKTGKLYSISFYEGNNEGYRLELTFHSGYYLNVKTFNQEFYFKFIEHLKNL
jgi:hypothetical protein